MLRESVQGVDQLGLGDLPPLVLGQLVPALLFILSVVLLILAVRAMIAPKWKPLVVSRLRARGLAVWRGKLR